MQCGVIMGKQKRKWHSKFIEYMQKIVRHPVYAGMPVPYKANGDIQWICAGKSPLGKQREMWWDKKREELGIKKAPGWKAVVARKIHPFGQKPCQICGRELKLAYVYPNKTYPGAPDPFTEITNHSCPAYNATGQCSHLGPGAMSDCPDRFDGFHTYNRCCRSKEDTGRHADNLSRYGEDRRAYEFWADGDWKAASWLEMVFRKAGISPDHIGPLSLGFCHRPKFRPMTTRDNTAKGNRLTLQDISDLITDEKNGTQVVSWHSRFIWDKVKSKIRTPAQAKYLSSIMRKNLHFVLNFLAQIKSNGSVYEKFLIDNFLHPNYALYQHEFVGFDAKTGTYSKIITKSADRTEQKRNADRYIRKSLEALDKYIGKKNRNVEFALDEVESIWFYKALTAIKSNDSKKALISIETALCHRAERLTSDFIHV